MSEQEGRAENDANSPQDFPGANPAWTDVPQHLLGTSPYRSICRIHAYRNGNRIAEGTGWLAQGGRVVTAAHVAFSAERCEMQFAGTQTWVNSVNIRIHPAYRRPNGGVTEGSPADLARIDLAAPMANGLNVAAFAHGAVMAIGYDGNRLVQHSGAAYPWESYLLHAAHTDAGHSGCPVLSGGQVVGVHVSARGTAEAYFAAPSPAGPSLLNAAIKFDAQSLRFLNGL
ncbi:MAG TPA: hypothetical protein VE053_10615 [Allosphingosinicella sp.]|nr:hypothetical protein [Allosphingosinicella sp.]